MATIEHVRTPALALPGAEERAMTGGAAWFVRNKLFAWECHPWPSIPDDINRIIAAEPCVGVKVADAVDARALREMHPGAFLRETTRWGEPKVAFRLGAVAADHVVELVIEAWHSQAPQYLRRAFDDVAPR